MNNFIKTYENYIKDIIISCGYEIDNVTLNISSRPDLGEFQYNGIMAIAKKYNKKPYDIANEVVGKLSTNDAFINLNIAGPGFINISFSNKALIDYMNIISNDLSINIGSKDRKKIVIDFGGANVAKVLHVGHLRSANIGEALKRLAKALNYEVISDVHLGDFGRQIGMVIQEIKVRYPDLVYFDETYKGEYPKYCPITNKDLEELYPIANQKAKEDEDIMDEAREITAKLQNGHPGYVALWKHIIELSKIDIKKIYDELNASFDLWEGESDSFKYVDEMMAYLNSKNLVYESEGALVMNVALETDEAEVPPLILKKTDGAVLYSTTELATIYSRMKRFNPDEIWYVVDNRQALHFKQVFRAAYKSGIVPASVKLNFISFGTVNGKDGKPYKTRDGGVMTLSSLLDLVKDETKKRLSPNIGEDEKNEIVKDIAISALKYADLLPNISTDYVFDPIKFSDLNGKTGPYLLYSTIRMKSLLDKAKEQNAIVGPVSVIANTYDKDIILNLLNTPIVLESSLNAKSLNDIAEYLYQLTSSYNNFYAENYILNEQDLEKKSSWLAITKIVYETDVKLLNILGINIPKKM